MNKAIGQAHATPDKDNLETRLIRLDVPLAGSQHRKMRDCDMRVLSAYSLPQLRSIHGTVSSMIVA